MYVYDDKTDQNTFETNNALQLKLSNDSLIHHYDRNSFKYDRTGILASLQYSVDKGLMLGAGYLIEKQGFRKDPYAFKQDFWAHYTTGRKSFNFKYSADFKSLWNKNDFLIQLESDGPNNQENFLGWEIIQNLRNVKVGEFNIIEIDTIEFMPTFTKKGF